MALSPENRDLITSTFGDPEYTASIADNGELSPRDLNDLLNAARAQGRASLEERVRELAALWDEQQSRYPLDASGRGASAAVSCCAIELRHLLATPGERENG